MGANSGSILSPNPFYLFDKKLCDGYLKYKNAIQSSLPWNSLPCIALYSYCLDEEKID